MQYVVFDTGSTIFWIQCHPCDPCVDQDTQHYSVDPKKILRWSDSHCPTTNPKFFDDEGLCAYRVRYKDGTTTSGKLARVTYGIFNSEFIVFGCSYSTTPESAFGNPIITGVLGMGKEWDSHSVVSQNWDGRFSFCFESDTVELQRDRILVGPDSKVLPGANELEMIEGRVESHLYDVRLEGMHVWSSDGWQKINVDPGTFDGGCALDTGTAMTHLVADAYDAVVSSMDDYFKRQGFIKQFSNPGFEKLCYEPNITTDLSTVQAPPVMLQFKGISGDPVYMMWGEKQLFDTDKFGGRCLQIVPTHESFTTIGAHQMTDIFFTFDLVKKRIYFSPLPHCNV
ncbi:Eukaryotic aspartyl protease family protein [Rhynchospora pubera]|uniref:Eukaryotic aspartyl protease family protein n=1 Tax=Rhynchospora pubera TaxID=906938 RepID=A0AAV8C6H8_9POAL|nr:Eukaryotic aspartyl protease family protein [Rhynchospora pubera]